MPHSFACRAIADRETATCEKRRKVDEIGGRVEWDD
jgi:hypothetical protein